MRDYIIPDTNFVSGDCLFGVTLYGPPRPPTGMLRFGNNFDVTGVVVKSASGMTLTIFSRPSLSQFGKFLQSRALPDIPSPPGEASSSLFVGGHHPSLAKEFSDVMTWLPIGEVFLNPWVVLSPGPRSTRESRALLSGLFLIPGGTLVFALESTTMTGSRDTGGFAISHWSCSWAKGLPLGYKFTQFGGMYSFFTGDIIVIKRCVSFFLRVEKVPQIIFVSVSAPSEQCETFC